MHEGGGRYFSLMFKTIFGHAVMAVPPWQCPLVLNMISMLCLLYPNVFIANELN